MSLTTRAAVLTRLGLADDAATESAIALFVGSPLTSCDFVVAGTTLTVTPNTGSPSTFGLTASAYDTIGELATAIDALSSIMAVATAATSTPSSLLDAQTASVTPSSLGQLTYTNTATSTSSALIDQLILEVSSKIALHCERANQLTQAEEFTSGARDEYYDGDGQPNLILKNYPATTITTVSTVDYDGNATAVSSADYRLNADGTALNWRGAHDGYPIGAFDADGFPSDGTTGRVGWPCGTRNIRVQYTAGFSSIPAGLQGVATDMVVEAYLNRRTNERTSADAKGGGRAVSYRSIDDILKSYVAALAPWRSNVVGGAQ